MPVYVTVSLRETLAESGKSADSLSTFLSRNERATVLKLPPDKKHPDCRKTTGVPGEML